LGYDNEGKLTMQRQGKKNQLICLVDDPWNKAFHGACYHKDLEPFMAMGRKLKRGGFHTQDIRRLRAEAAESGTLKMPEKPANLFVFDVNQEMVYFHTGEVQIGRLLAVVHIPYLTGEESGFPTQPVSTGIPGLMDTGTHRAHIVITPSQ